MKPTTKRFFPHVFVVCFSPVFAVLASRTHAADAVFSSGAFTRDATSGVTTIKTCTASSNVVGGDVVVIGKTFRGTGTDPAANRGWTQAGYPNGFGSGGNKTSSFGGQNITTLFNGFIRGGALNPGTVTFTGLTAGQTHVTTYDCQDWSWPIPTARTQSVNGTEGAPNFIFNEDAVEASMLRYTFVATGTSTTICTLPAISGAAYHFFNKS